MGKTTNLNWCRISAINSITVFFLQSLPNLRLAFSSVTWYGLKCALQVAILGADGAPNWDPGSCDKHVWVPTWNKAEKTGHQKKRIASQAPCFKIALKVLLGTFFAVFISSSLFHMFRVHMKLKERESEHFREPKSPRGL